MRLSTTPTTKTFEHNDNSVIVGRNYGKSRLWKRRTTITLASGAEYSCQFRQAIVYVKIGSSRHRKQFYHVCKEYGIRSAHNDENGFFVPVQSFGDYNAAFELFGTPNGMAILCSQNCVLRYENVFAGANAPRGMGKLEPFVPANTRLAECKHDTGKPMPTDKEIGVVHGKVFRKPKGKAKAFKTIRHESRLREVQLDGTVKVTRENIRHKLHAKRHIENMAQDELYGCHVNDTYHIGRYNASNQPNYSVGRLMAKGFDCTGIITVG